VSGGLTWRALVDAAEAEGIERGELVWLGREASGADAGAWATVLDEPAPARGASRFRTMVDRRRRGEPLQYVLGSWGFRRLDLLVDHRVLIPRPETEWVVEQALGLLPSDGVALVVDLGTGSGAIALSIADERWPHVRVVATDASAAALGVAGANLAGLGRRASMVTLHLGSWWEAVPAAVRGTVDLVVSNPPYVAAGEKLPPAVADWEPVSALVSGPTGLEALEVVLTGAAEWLRPGGWVVCEIGETQGAAAITLATDAGLVDVEVRPDLTGRDRMVVARRAGSP
jgi:release factor glutamine methyltransferase